ncbi:unnamed protein product [Pylaiella littoralis]
MTVRVRLQRFGRRNRPFYRVVVADSRSPRNGKFIELVGTYNPLATRSGAKEVTFKVDRIRYWVSVGAQPSDRVAWLLGQFGILPPKVVPVARTKQIMPRKEWKELKKKEAKGFHTSAACFTVLRPSSGEPINALSQAVHGASGGWAAGQIAGQPQHLNADSRFQLASAALLDTGCLSPAWGTGQAAARTAAAASAPAKNSSDDLAAMLSRMLLGRLGRAEQKTQSSAAAPQAAAFSPLRDVLSSNLRLLGPAACSMIGLQDGAVWPRDTR